MRAFISGYVETLPSALVLIRFAVLPRGGTPQGMNIERGITDPETDKTEVWQMTSRMYVGTGKSTPVEARVGYGTTNFPSRWRNTDEIRHPGRGDDSFGKGKELAVKHAEHFFLLRALNISRGRREVVLLTSSGPRIQRRGNNGITEGKSPMRKSASNIPRSLGK